MVVSFYQNQHGCDVATFVQHLDSIYIDLNAAKGTSFELASGNEAG